jgi:hypothetical protein
MQQRPALPVDAEPATHGAFVHESMLFAFREQRQF